MSQVFTLDLYTGWNVPSTVKPSTTAITYFPPALNTSIGVSSTAVGYVACPGNNQANGQRLYVKATGNFEVGSGGTCPSVTIGLYPVTLLQPSSLGNSSASPVGSIGATAIISYPSTLQNLTGTLYPWALSAEFAGDAGSGLVQQVDGWIAVDGTVTTLTQRIVTGLSGINFANPLPFGFAVGITYSVAEPGNSANMYQFSCSRQSNTQNNNS